MEVIIPSNFGTILEVHYIYFKCSSLLQIAAIGDQEAARFNQKTETEAKVLVVLTTQFVKASKVSRISFWVKRASGMVTFCICRPKLQVPLLCQFTVISCWDTPQLKQTGFQHVSKGLMI